MEPKKSTLTLRLDEETTALIEQLKQKTGRTTASDLVRYLIHNWDRSQNLYWETVRRYEENKRELTQTRQTITLFVEAYERLKALSLRE
jgi:predicted DNA-binding protein